MHTFSQAYAALRRKNYKQYALLASCCFFSVLLITAYASMMRSPTILSVLPEGGDSRKQVMMIFVLAVFGCGMLTMYASGLFFRYKSREVGIFLALGASKPHIAKLLRSEVTLLSVLSCIAGTVLGVPLAWLVWRLFRLFLVDTEEMLLRFEWESILFALAFTVFTVLMLYVMLARFLRRTNIMDVVNESHKAEPIRRVPRWYGIGGIVLTIGGCFLGYLVPVFCVLVLHWYAPEGLTAVFYLPVFIGIYMLLLHTVVNGWRGGKHKYRNIISTSMMKFQGRQTVRNMLVITVLIAGAYFGAFYTPVLGTGASMSYDQRTVDYAFHYRADQDMPQEQEIRQMAQEENVVITDYTAQDMATLAIDGEEYVEQETKLGTTYRTEYRETQQSMPTMSASAYTALTGQPLTLNPGETVAVFMDSGDGAGVVGNDVSKITNIITGKSLPVKSLEQPLCNTMLLGTQVMNDADYADLTAGLPDTWREVQVFFNVENVDTTYAFAKRLFYAIVDRSTKEVELLDAWDPVIKQQKDAAGESYWCDPEQVQENGFSNITYDKRDSAEFRMYWKYMPQFRVLDKADFVKTTAVFITLFIFIALICFAAVIVIAYTRSMTIALTNARVYDDLRHLGAGNAYLLSAVRKQVAKVFCVPYITGTGMIYLFYIMILYFNDGGRLSQNELAGLGVCLIVIAVTGLLFYGVYRLTLRKVCHTLKIKI